ncbi:MAG TPA: site-2 protease family protein [Patescibacteria group bacterium]|nr:site-2 protease family protein [Patescibacteria group bacterium]
MTVIFAVASFIIFIYSIILHEIAHGWMAERLGDPTARISGRLTLNPLSHIDPLMSVLLPLFLLISQSPIIIGAAKPVPIDPYNLRNSQKEMGLIGLAGPLTNLLLAILFASLARLLTGNTALVFWPLLANATLLNIVLAVFNLIPIPPLDGGRVLISLLPRRYAEQLMSLENFGIFIVLFLFLFPNPLFSLQGIMFRLTRLIFSLIFPGFPLP